MDILQHNNKLPLIDTALAICLCGKVVVSGVYN